MTYQEVESKCQQGYLAIIPGWIGYLQWDYSTNQLCFKNNEYTLSQNELKKLIQDRTDLYYII